LNWSADTTVLDETDEGVKEIAGIAIVRDKSGRCVDVKIRGWRRQSFGEGA
jgi:hypothetical protein